MEASREAGDVVTQALIYHDVVDDAGAADATGFPGPLAHRYKLTVDDFERHLDAIAATGVDVGLFSMREPDAGCALTFDDGGRSAVRAAAALERRGWRGHFFVTTGMLGTPGFMSAADVRQLHDRGHVVGSHSVTHPTYMATLPRHAVRREWVASRDVLTDVLGSPPRIASVPGGFSSDTVLEEAAAAGYAMLLTSQPTSKVRIVDGLRVHGRYTVWRTTPAAQAAGYAQGSRIACGRLRLEWSAKGVVKRANPRVYQALRHVRAGLR